MEQPFYQTETRSCDKPVHVEHHLQCYSSFFLQTKDTASV